MQATVLYGAAMFGSRTVRTRRLSNRPTPSFDSRSRAFAGGTSGPIEAFSRSHHRPQWATTASGDQDAAATVIAEPGDTEI